MLRILLIDQDDKERGRILRMIAFSSFDASVQEAANVQFALRQLADEQVDCILASDALCNGNNPNLLNELGKIDPSQRPGAVIYGDAEDPRKPARLIAEGANDFLARDALTPESLKTAIQNGVEKAILLRELDQLRNELRLMTLTDSLTGLANQQVFQDRLDHAMKLGLRQKNSVCVLILDLDGFKDINDNHGRAAGDEALCITANRLKQLGRQADTLARLGGDTFAIILEGGTKRDGAALVARNITRIIGEPILLKGHEIKLEATIGIAEYPADGTLTEDIIKRAYGAMSALKRGHGLRGD